MRTVAGGRAGARMLVVAVLLALVACGQGGGSAPEPGRAKPEPSPTLTSPAPTREAPRARRPNLLVIEADDMRWDDLRWMPNVRRLVQDRGLTFANSFAPYPLCCPSRASFLTGTYTHNHAVYSHDDPWGFAAFKDRRTLATVLQGAGYRTALVGKYLNRYGEQPVRRTGHSSLGYVPPGWDEWYAGTDRVWQLTDGLTGGTYEYFNLTQNINGSLRNFAGQYSTDVLGAQVRELVGRFGQRWKPWFVWWTPVAPHHGSPTEPDDPGTTLRGDGYPTTWVSPARPEWVKGRFDRRITHGAGVPPDHPAEGDVSDKPRYLRGLPELTAAEREALTTVTRQRAESLYVLDVQIGRTLAQLRRTGQLRHTVVLFTSDNGYYLGEHRKRQGKINVHEPSLRVPLLVSGPGVPRGRRYDPVSTVDLAPTLAAYAGTRMPRADGVDLGPVVRDGDRGWRRPVVTEARMPQRTYLAAHRGGRSPLNVTGLRLGQWKITRYSTGEVELYDLARDPLELRNLARAPQHRRILARLTRSLRLYRECRGRTCAAPLPADLQLTPAQNRRLTDRQVRRTRAWFGE